jgi:hypothetical protein
MSTTLISHPYMTETTADQVRRVHEVVEALDGLSAKDGADVLVLAIISLIDSFVVPEHRVSVASHLAKQLLLNFDTVEGSA